MEVQQDHIITHNYKFYDLALAAKSLANTPFAVHLGEKDIHFREV